MTCDDWIVTVCAVVFAAGVPVAAWDHCREKYRAVIAAAEHLTRTAAKERTP